MSRTHSRTLAAVKRFIADEAGTTAVEYTLIASVISIAIVGAAMSLGTTLRDDFFGKAASAFPPAP
jgi:pilus assembly protein Flp/PilA